MPTPDYLVWRLLIISPTIINSAVSTITCITRELFTIDMRSVSGIVMKRSIVINPRGATYSRGLRF